MGISPSTINSAVGGTCPPYTDTTQIRNCYNCGAPYHILYFNSAILDNDCSTCQPPKDKTSC